MLNLRYPQTLLGLALKVCGVELGAGVGLSGRDYIAAYFRFHRELHIMYFVFYVLRFEYNKG